MNVVGIVRGRTVLLETVPPALEGCRVRVVLEVIDAPQEQQLSAEEQQQAWSKWVAHGPQGPIEGEAGGWP